MTLLQSPMSATLLGIALIAAAVFGSLYSDLSMFTGLVGLSISLNGGVAQPEHEPLPELTFGGRALRAGGEPQAAT